MNRSNKGRAKKRIKKSKAPLSPYPESQAHQYEQYFYKLLEFNESLLKVIPFGMDIVDEEGTILYVNDNLRKMFKEEIIGKKCWDAYRDDKSQCLRCPLKSGVDYQQTRSLETSGVLNGRTFSITHTGMMYNGKRAILEIFQDITEKKADEDKINKLQNKILFERNKLEQVLNVDQKMSMIKDADALTGFIVDKASKILEADKCSFMTYDPQKEYLTVNRAKGLDEKYIKKSRVRLGQSVAGIVAQREKAILVRDIESDSDFARKNRLSYKGKSFISAPVKVDGNLLGVVNVADKVSPDGASFTKTDLKLLKMLLYQASVAFENAQSFLQLQDLSVTDPLTNLYNFRYFSEKLDTEIRRINRYEQPLSLLMLDVDDFKMFNDRYGHLEGDRVLKEVSKAIKEATRNVDIACRYAGDEFAVILPATSLSHAEIVAKRIVSLVNKVKLRKKLKVSIGAAQFIEGQNRDDFIAQADQALYQAKDQKSSKVCCA